MIWQPIVTAPKDGTQILVYTTHGDVEVTNWYRVEYDRYEEVEGGLYKKVRELSGEGWNGNFPILWMPMPESPTKAQANKARTAAEKAADAAVKQEQPA